MNRFYIYFKIDQTTQFYCQPFCITVTTYYFYKVKTWVIYIFAILYLTSSTQLSQLYKLPVFISHFIEHDKGGDFFDEMKAFLVHHYGGHDKDEDWETDQKLPFMKVEIAHIDLAAIPKITFITPLLLKELIQTSFNYFEQDELYSHYLNTIWQPPQQA